MYFQGLGVAADLEAAENWYRRAAEQGHSPAQYNLGVMYYNGDGVPQDYVLAHVWANLAAAHGHENAAQLREEFAEQLTVEDIATAQEIARRCLEQDYEDCDR